MTETLVFAGIAPHPPLLVPEVGGTRTKQVQASVNALKDFSLRVIKTQPQTIVIISPHSPSDPLYFGAFARPFLGGDFSFFGAKQISLHFANDLELLQQLKIVTQEYNLPFRTFNSESPLDHGVLVPMYYLNHAGWQGNLLALSFTALSVTHHVKFGHACREAASRIARKIAFIASADLSHYLSPNGHYPFEPTAHLFDQQICEAIANHNCEAIIHIDPELRTKAGECGYRSLLVAIGVTNEDISTAQLISYECPFGVGYPIAILKEKIDP